MKHDVSEVSIEKLASLARGAGVSAEQEMPDNIKKMLMGRRASDKVMQQRSGSGFTRQVIGLFRF